MNGIMLNGMTIEDLLGRDVAPIYGEAAKTLIAGKTVLVTGAGGSIGSEIVRQLHALRAGRVICVDISEYGLYQVEYSLWGNALLTDEEHVLADITDAAAMDRIFAQFKPEIVFHAAAVKQLPLLEKSPWMAIKHNVLGTNTVAQAAVAHGAGWFVNISTDKAANPTSVLGMTKRLAEMVAAQYIGQGTRIASVRFGNVFASRGSFIETMQMQIRDGVPITLTHEEATRFFMTIPQAAGLVIEAAVMANGGHTYVLDMGNSYRILGLVKRYAAHGGIKPVIRITGLRPGEKLHESLFDTGEDVTPTAHPAISMAHVGEDVPLDEITKLYSLIEGDFTADSLRSELVRLTQVATPLAED